MSLAKSIAALIEHESGAIVSFGFGADLFVFRLENGDYMVSAPEHKEMEREFGAPLRAAQYFTELRHKFKMGFDYESNHPPCCGDEQRKMNGGCDNCGAPAL